MTAEGEFQPRHATGGLIDGRHLFAIQTFDVARLTSHVVPLVPGTFIAVSGQGPKMDSNGSGKTSFLIAVSLLLADPQWRLDVFGGKNAAGVLFKPDSAGMDPAQQIRPASVGYIAGVFAYADDPAGSAITVWVRLSTSAPYLQVRWGEGVRLADHEEDGGRDLQADEIWQMVKGNGTCSARRMAETLYGDAPQCLSYLDTPLRPPVPSLLSQQMTEMGPREIAESLIALSGSLMLLEQEQTERGDVVNRQKNYDDVVEDQKRQYLLDETELANIAARDGARQELTEAQRFWNYYLASRYLTVLDQEQDYERLLSIGAQALSEADEEARNAKEYLDQWNDSTDVEAAEEDARQAYESATHRLRDLQDQRATLVGQRKAYEPQQRTLLEATTTWNGQTPEEAQRKVDEALGELTSASLEAERDRDRHESLHEQLKRAEAGRSGEAGRVIDLLESAAITGTALVEAVEILPEARHSWEPRLWPWREAVVVEHKHIGPARRAVASMPGAMLVATDPHDHQNDRTGVICTLPISDFLAELQDRWSDQDLHGLRFVTDEAAHLTVFGGFDSPVAGREELLRTLRVNLDLAAETAATSQGRKEAATADHELARAAFDTAVAAVELKRIEAAIEQIDVRVAATDKKIGPAKTKESGLEEEWREKLIAKQGYELKVAAARTAYQEKAASAAQTRGRVEGLESDRVRLQVERWRALWGGDKHGASALIETNLAKNPLSARATALECVARAVTKYGIDESSAAAPQEIVEAARLRHRLAGTDALTVPAVLLEDIVAPLRVRLESHVGRDRSMRARIERDREQKARLVENAETELRLGQERLMMLQDMIERHLEGILVRVSDAFDRLDRERGGFGAELRFSSERPTGPGDWSWQVTPRWRRSRSGPLVSYREIANGAQVKVYAVQLVLAAVLADAHTSGRVLVLDELGNSLGEINRKDVLGALKTVAEETNVTILGTCQDSVLIDAADVCGELMWFEHANSADAFNQPTRAWGYDDNGDRVDTIHPWLGRGRDDK